MVLGSIDPGRVGRRRFRQKSRPPGRLFTFSTWKPMATTILTPWPTTLDPLRRAAAAAPRAVAAAPGLRAETGVHRAVEARTAGPPGAARATIDRESGGAVHRASPGAARRGSPGAVRRGAAHRERAGAARRERARPVRRTDVGARQIDERVPGPVLVPRSRRAGPSGRAGEASLATAPRARPTVSA